MGNSGNRPSFLKRQYIVDPKMQFVVLAYSFFMSTISVIITAFSFMSFQFISGHAATVEISQGAVTSATLAIWVIAVSVLTGIGVLISHRIAGPVFRLRVHMQQVAAGGEIAQIGFRKGDHFLELAAAYNLLLERLAKAEGTSSSGKLAD